MSRRRRVTRGLRILVVLLAGAAAAGAEELRKMIPLDGTWEIAEGGLDKPPERFDRKIPVPGLVDMAEPAFDEVGVKSARREAFWYRRAFRVEGAIPAVAVLKVHKARYGSRVLLNGTPLGDHLPSFTPGHFDARPALRAGDNEILIRIGAFRESVPRHVPSGYDKEKKRYLPGIFDSVELILCGTPHVLRVQAAPDIETKAVTVHAWVRHAGPPAPAKLAMTVREAVSGKAVGEGSCEIPAASPGPEFTAHVTIPLRDARLWSPEDPFLYDLEARGAGDVLKTRFGLRSFRLDPATGRAILNGKPYFLRGSNVTLYRFFEDSERKDRPWREEWVRRLHKAFKGMHWNSLRYCIGFPPEFWYRIADEEGILIQDEFPIWNMGPRPGDFETDQLVAEYTEWMRERWNHPCVVIWDACNETRAPQTGEVIQRVRKLDLSNRPWDNGWSKPVDPGDVSEQHPYHFQKATYKLSNLATASGTAGWAPGKNAVINNEYGWLWLNRDGTPATLTRVLYRNLLGEKSTTEQRRRLYARYLAAETEFWRCRRACAGVLHFCALGYSRPDGQTSDHWIDVEKLTWEPEFLAYVRDAFAPVGLMIESWIDECTAGPGRDFPVVVINDLDRPWSGALRLRLLRGGAVLSEKAQPCEVPPLGQVRLTMLIDVPAQPGPCELEAALVAPGADPVRSRREFEIVTK
jgi:beta-galactosidase